MLLQGALAEWLRSGLQNRVHRFNSGRHLHIYARVAELVYAFDLKSNGENHMGSSPISGTMENAPRYFIGVIFMAF